MLVAAEDLQKSFGARAGVVPTSGVEGGLTTAGLVFREFDLAPDTAQNRRSVEPHLGKKLVNKAWNEERNPQGHARDSIAFQKRKTCRRQERGRNGTKNNEPQA